MKLPGDLRLSLLLVLAGVVLVGCRPGGERDDASAELVRPVVYLDTSLGQMAAERSFPARIAAADLRELTFPRPGVVEAVPVEESERVVAGQLLARLDTRDYVGALDAARARLETASQALERARRLLAEDAIAKNVFEQREAAETVARAEFEAAEKALSEAHVEAPFDGVVSRVFVRESQTVAAGSPAVRIFSMQSLEATIAVPASIMMNADGSRRSELGALVRLEGQRSRPIEARFQSAELEADARSQSFNVTFAFESPAGLNVLPGMNAELELVLDAKDSGGAVMVPLRAIGAEGDTRFVWVVDLSQEPHQVRRQSVVVGPAIGEQLPVIEGLEAGATIVGAGISSLSEGMQVRRWERPHE